MSYYKLLGLDKEPFSTSPDPAFFFLSEEHKAALCRLQITISLRRGLSVILGDVGTGKTTLSRKLAQALADDERVVFQMVLNPFFATEKQFLARVASLYRIKTPSRATSLDIMEAIERYLFKTGVEDGRIVVLLIDEAQMLPDFALETLRILLNYETNEFKILQLVLVGQMELLPKISSRTNFWDRIAMKYVINPLGEAEIRKLLDFRLKQAGYSGNAPIFTDQSIRLISRHTQGYPRKLAFFCHNCLEALVMHDRRQVTPDLVQKLIDAEVPPAPVPAHVAGAVPTGKSSDSPGESKVMTGEKQADNMKNIRRPRGFRFGRLRELVGIP